MNPRSSRPKRRTSPLQITVALLTLAALGATSAFAGTCGLNSPFFPTPEFREGVRLWTNDFQPANNPSSPIAARRDSTQYISQSFAGYDSGHELYWDVAAVDNQRLFAMYNAGLQAWDTTAGDADDPQLIAFVDAWRGDFLTHPAPGEVDGYLTDMEVIQDPVNIDDVLIAVGGLAPVGVTLWRYTKSTNTFTQLFQHESQNSGEVAIINYNGTVYAFVSNPSGGPAVYDVSKANQQTTGCRQGVNCPTGIFLGLISADKSRYISAIERGNKIYLALSFGVLSGAFPEPEIRELGNFPSSLTAPRRWQGTEKRTHSPKMFVKGGIHWMAAVEGNDMRIYNVDNCLDTSGCSSLPSAAVSKSLSTQNFLENFLVYSESNGAPFLYYGVSALFLEGPPVSQLWDLSSLGGTNQVPEIFDGAASYTDPCNGLQVKGWADRNERNHEGGRNVVPRRGLFVGPYFYNAAVGILDVWVLGNGPPPAPAITTSVMDTPPFWFGEAIDFSAAEANCDGPNSWSWFANDTDATGLGSTTATDTISWNLCGGSDCPDKNIEVWALKDSCAGDPNLIENRANINVSDPRPRIRSIDVLPTGTVFPVCTELTFTADLDGKAPFDYSWIARDDAGMPVASSTQPMFVWDTDGIDFGPEIFLDGFESGDTLGWDFTDNGSGLEGRVFGTPKMATIDLRQRVTKGGGSAIFDVELTATNPDLDVDFDQISITLTELGSIGFGTPAISPTDLGQGQFQFMANSQNATEWRWEIEDPENGGSAGCQFYASCTVIDFGSDDSAIDYVWQPPNVPGNYGVTVSIRNCNDLVGATADTSVFVDEIVNPDPPVMTLFEIPADFVTSGTCAFLPLEQRLDCPTGTSIPFDALFSGTADVIEVDWENDGVYESSFGVGSNITHSYSSPGDDKSPMARARDGALVSAPIELRQTLDIN